MIEFPGTREKGPQIGANTNVAVSIDPNASVSHYETGSPGSNRQVGLRITNDLADTCDSMAFVPLTVKIQDLEAGMATPVEFVDIDLLKVDEDAMRTVCVGYRSPGGVWHFDSAPATSFVTDNDHLRAHVAVNAASADALKIVVRGGGAPLRQISFTIGGAKE